MNDVRVTSRPGYVASVGRVFDLALPLMLWSRRSVFMTLLVGAPIGLAFAIRAISALMPGGVNAPMGNLNRVGGPLLFGTIVWLLYVRFIVPVLGVFYGTGLIADEVDDRTITYLFTRPIPRAAVFAGKYLAYLLCTILLVLPSTVIVFFLLVTVGGGSIGDGFVVLVRDLCVMAAGLAAYGAVFGLVGARVKHPLIAGLAFAFGWEPAVMMVPGYLKGLTVAYYLQGVAPPLFPDDMRAQSVIQTMIQFFTEVPSVRASLFALTAITVLALWWGGRTVEQREYVLEQ